MHRLFLGLAFFLGALGVAAGAFGAHGLSDRLSAANLEIFETAARYHVYHALALGLVSLAMARWPLAVWNGPALLFLGGVLIFSGTLYALAITDVRWLGAITPIGGGLLIAAWVWAGWIALTRT
ncbi:MAG: DUF423 domain-containing protein [Gemmatimonadetes bacterium]|nr:DUF423 domain-containing protein [Gemmatimonadota bacterium]